jgi:hypothetical protein
MKLTESKLRSVIKQELVKFLNEMHTPEIISGEEHEKNKLFNLTNEPSVEQAYGKLVGFLKAFQPIGNKIQLGYADVSNYLYLVGDLRTKLDLAFGDKLDSMNLSDDEKDELYDELYNLEMMKSLDNLYNYLSNFISKTSSQTTEKFDFKLPNTQALISTNTTN